MTRIWTIYRIRPLTADEQLIVGLLDLRCACGATATHDATYRYHEGGMLQNRGRKMCGACAHGREER